MILKEDGIALVPGELMIPELRAAIDAANPYAEGRWIFLRISCSRELVVVKKLIEIRAAQG